MSAPTVDQQTARPEDRSWWARGRAWIAWFGAGRLAGAALSVVIVAAGGWWLVHPPATPVEQTLPRAGAASARPAATSVPGGSTISGPRLAPSTIVPPSLVVHVAGAVRRPGLYAVPAGARVADAVARAGGATPGAEVDALNLAQPVLDGQRIYVPALGHPALAEVGGAGRGSAALSGPVDLNRADAVELDGLPGIGPATAAAIVAYRQANGPFASVDDLTKVRGIGPAKLGALRALVTV